MTMTLLYDQIGEALKTQRERFGPEALANRRRVISLLADIMPEARREIRAVASALDEGAVEALSSVERSLLGMEMDRQADRLEQAVGLRADIAKQVIRALAYGLNLGPAPSVYEVAPSPAPRRLEDSWAGVSQPLPAQPALAPGVYHPAPPTLGTAPTSAPLFRFQGYAITRTHAFLAAGALAVILIATPLLSAQNQPASTSGHDQAQVQGYAGEMTDMGVATRETLESNVGSPTPLNVPGAQRLTTNEVRALTTRDRNVLLIDVLADQHQSTIQGAHYLPAAGQPGTFNDAAQQTTARALSTLTQNVRERPLVFFCAGSACWESYNAVLRARAAGYSRLYWYRGGLASWNAAGLPFQALPAATN